MKQMLTLMSATSAVFAASAANAETSACAAILNTAHLQVAGTTVISSNPASMRVAERLDLQLTTGAASVSLTQGNLSAIPFTLVNQGNGEEAFTIDGRIDGSDAVIETFVFDRDGNGVFDPSADLAIPARAATPLVAAGGTLRLLAMVRGGTAQAGGTLQLTAHALTGNGAPGNAFTGTGDGGCDAVVGGTGAAGAITVTLTAVPGSNLAQVDLAKSQTIVAENGSAEPTPRAIVTYTIESRFGGTGVVRSVRLADLIPQGTDYVPGSIRLDGTPITDASDGDAGDFDGTGIRVALGDVTAPATRRISFQVKIK